MSSISIDESNFQSEIMQSDKKVLLDFWASWCGPCRSLSAIIDEIAHERPDIKVCKINVGEQPELAKQFDVRSVPTLVVINDGEVVTRETGAKPKKAILDML